VDSWLPEKRKENGKKSHSDESIDQSKEPRVRNCGSAEQKKGGAERVGKGTKGLDPGGGGEGGGGGGGGGGGVVGGGGFGGGGGGGGGG